MINNNFKTKQYAQLNLNGASVDAFYGPWDSRTAFETWATDTVGLSDIPDAVTIAVRNTDGTITKYVRENDAWREDGRVADIDKAYVDAQLAAKANVTSLASALQTMASKTELQAGLADKVNASDVAAKADKTYVDTQLATKANVTALAQKQDTITDLATIRSNSQLAATSSTSAANAATSAQQAAASASNASTQAQQARQYASNVQTALQGIIDSDSVPDATVALAVKNAADIATLSASITNNANFVEVQEAGFFIVDENMNVGFAVKSNKVVGKNIMDIEIIS